MDIKIFRTHLRNWGNGYAERVKNHGRIPTKTSPTTQNFLYSILDAASQGDPASTEELNKVFPA